MPTPRKWIALAPEARRLAAAGLSAMAIAAQLGVNRSTVHRWMVAGRLGDTRGTRALEVPEPVATLAPAPTWAEAIRTAHALDPTDDEIVTLAAFALGVTQDPREPTSVRLAAAGRFQALIKQLAAHLRPAADEQPVIQLPAPTARADPRAQLMSIQ